jgi:hypothetical protein
LGIDNNDKEYLYELLKFATLWSKDSLSLMRTEEDRTLIPRYLEVLEKIKALIEESQNTDN